VDVSASTQGHTRFGGQRDGYGMMRPAGWGHATPSLRLKVFVAALVISLGGGILGGVLD